jgi:mRNA-degrading endonuclease RelE of RelBE toxin-antitoxin system
LAEPAELVYKELSRLASEAEGRGDPTNNHCTTLRMVDEVLDRIIPHNPIDRRNALAANLSNIYRYGKGRMRIFWIASSQKRKVYVLYISEAPRKEGDAYDPYEVFGRMVLTGRFNAFFDELGVRLSDVARFSAPSLAAD